MDSGVPGRGAMSATVTSMGAIKADQAFLSNCPYLGQSVLDYQLGSFSGVALLQPCLLQRQREAVVLSTSS